MRGTLCRDHDDNLTLELDNHEQNEIFLIIDKNRVFEKILPRTPLPAVNGSASTGSPTEVYKFKLSRLLPFISAISSLLPLFPSPSLLLRLRLPKNFKQEFLFLPYKHSTQVRGFASSAVKSHWFQLKINSIPSQSTQDLVRSRVSLLKFHIGTIRIRSLVFLRL